MIKLYFNKHLLVDLTFVIFWGHLCWFECIPISLSQCWIFESCHCGRGHINKGNVYPRQSFGREKHKFEFISVKNTKLILFKSIVCQYDFPIKGETNWPFLLIIFLEDRKRVLFCSINFQTKKLNCLIECLFYNFDPRVPKRKLWGR